MGTTPELRCFTAFLPGALSSEGSITLETLARFLPFRVDLFPQVCSSVFSAFQPGPSLERTQTSEQAKRALQGGWQGKDPRVVLGDWPLSQAGAGLKQVWSRGVQGLQKPLQPQRWTRLWVSPMTVCNSGQRPSVQSSCN